VEYDHVPATQLDRRLAVGETGLFLAGQINGTSGYEEAAVQGFWAGVNAARWVAGEPAWGLSPRQAHLAVLIDELVGRELGEPLRMFTSRSEARLSLREGNADLRLAEEGERLGLLSAAQATQARVRRERVAGELARLRAARVNPDRETLAALSVSGIAGFEQPSTLAELLARPELGWAQLTGALGLEITGLERADVEEIEAELKYAGYARRSARDQARVAGQMDWPIPADFVYRGLAGVSAEIQERLGATRPGTLGQAAQVPGVTPAALGILAIHVARARRQEAGCA
jgi:tRNA uridine 5-carboxymethylaminomethyl modification enzyme